MVWLVAAANARAAMSNTDKGDSNKAFQALLGHVSISATADTYTDWDVQQLEASLIRTFAVEDEEE